MGAEPVLELDGLTVAYGPSPHYDQVSLVVRPAEVVALLGPSGSGKSTLLNAVAGFLAPSAGTIRLRQRVVADASRAEPPERRDVGVVFQNYALWPHLSALDTVAYPLRRRGQSRAAGPGRGATDPEPAAHRRVGRPPTRPSCPAVSSSGWGWPGRWPGRRRSTCSTSRPPIWTPMYAGCSSTSWSPAGRPPAQPRCMPPTMPRRPSGWRTGWRCSTAGGWFRSARRRRCTTGRST